MYLKKLFKTKKKYKAFKKRYPEYQGKQDPEEVQNYIKDIFLEEAKSNNDSEDFIKYLFTNFTCAIDTEKMEFAWKSIKEWIVDRRMRRGGFEL